MAQASYCSDGVNAEPLADLAMQHAVTEPYTIRFSDLRDGSLKIALQDKVIVIDSDLTSGVTCQTVLSLTGKRCASVKTNDNGACAIHAVFGSPSASHELFHPQARKLIGEMLGTSLSVLKAKLGEEHQFLRAVITSLWSELAEPWLSGATAGFALVWFVLIRVLRRGSW